MQIWIFFQLYVNQLKTVSVRFGLSGRESSGSRLWKPDARLLLPYLNFIDLNDEKTWALALLFTQRLLHVSGNQVKFYFMYILLSRSTVQLIFYFTNGFYCSNKLKLFLPNPRARIVSSLLVSSKRINFLHLSIINIIARYFYGNGWQSSRIDIMCLYDMQKTENINNKTF